MIAVILFTVIMSGMLGVSIGYHRYLAHKSFKVVRWFEILIVFLGIPAGTPIQWAGNHRAHHMFTDTEKDPDAYNRPRTNQQYNDYAKDVASDPVFAWMSKPLNYFCLVMMHTLVFLIIIGVFFGMKGLLLTYLCYIYVYNVGDGVDSVGHLWGSRNEGSKHKATNNSLLGPLAFGDGWHANHHDHPSRARHGLSVWQIDPSYITLRLLSFIGIVKDLKK